MKSYDALKENSTGIDTTIFYTIVYQHFWGNQAFTIDDLIRLQVESCKQKMYECHNNEFYVINILDCLIKISIFYDLRIHNVIIDAKSSTSSFWNLFISANVVTDSYCTV